MATLGLDGSCYKPKEATMHPIIAHEAAKARIADRHRQAERGRVAQAARLARKPHRRRFMPGDLATGFARRARAVLAARSPPPVPAPGQAPKAAT
jgi:hypothetical protein